ncbi:unnamed protein product [Sphagnum balticum]
MQSFSQWQAALISPGQKQRSEPSFNHRGHYTMQAIEHINVASEKIVCKIASVVRHEIVSRPKRECKRRVRRGCYQTYERVQAPRETKLLPEIRESASVTRDELRRLLPCACEVIFFFFTGSKSHPRHHLLLLLLLVHVSSSSTSVV